jgi:hypothetical protein
LLQSTLLLWHSKHNNVLTNANGKPKVKIYDFNLEGSKTAVIRINMYTTRTAAAVSHIRAAVCKNLVPGGHSPCIQTSTKYNALMWYEHAVTLDDE